ncbi:MAG: elongation factor P [Anaerolineaceae bacterium]|jgi:elongation factor P|nr:elongation factor P [Anaerolineaceae bacterium]
MIDVNELRKGVTFELDGNLYKVLDYGHNKSGRGSATIRIKARNMITGSTIEKTFNSGQTVQDVRLDYHNAQYLYNDGEFYYFMDNDTYDQYPLQSEILADSTNFLKENMEVKITFYNEKAIDIELPISVDLEVTYAEIAVKGDTATGQTKKVEVETGTTIFTPYFISTGDIIRVDTRTGEYITRVTQ